MAKAKQSGSAEQRIAQQTGSAAQRRSQERQQRERRNETRLTARSVRGPSRGPTVRKKDRSNLYMVIGVLTLIVVVVVALIWFRNQPVSQTNTSPGLNPTPASAKLVQQITGVPQATWEAAGNGGSGVTNQFQGYSGQPPLNGPNGHPEFLYIGGEFCPHCAAQRWAMINALSRFGTFTNLSQIQAYEDSISTFSFYGSSYTSEYVDFVPVEVYGNKLNSDGTGYVPLQTMTADQQQIFNKYNSSQSFPFMDVANQYASVGATYQFTDLLDKSQNPLSWQTIANSLSDPTSTVGKDILGSANYLTAAICKATNQQPGNVCNSSVIQNLQQALSKKTSQLPSSSTNPLALNLPPVDLVAVQRRVLN